MIVLRNATREKLTRRRFLRGAGGAAIALPILHAAGGSAHAQVGEVPERFIGVFTAQGLPLEVTAPFFDYVGAGNTQPLAALRPFEEKITMVRGVDVRTQGPGRTEHTIGCASFLCGHDYDNVVSKGGTTLDWIIKEEKQLNTPLATLNSGIWGGDDADERGRIVHSWRGLNRPNEPIADTVRLFEYVFGDAPGGGGQANPEVTRQGRYRRSVLDAVMEEYAWARSEASGFGPGVRRLIDNHLETIRDLENRIAAQSQQGGALNGVTIPDKPASIPGSGAFPPNTANWDQIWDIVADIYVLAFRADLVRSGTYMIDSGGDQWAFDGRSGSTGNVHGTTMHNWRDSQHTAIAMEIWEWYYTKLADLLRRLDADDWVDVNGGTLLDNTTVLMGTELGDPVHDLNGLTFMIAGGKGRFAGGVHTFQDRTDVDLYNTILTAHGIDRRMGSMQNYSGDLTSILA